MYVLLPFLCMRGNVSYCCLICHAYLDLLIRQRLTFHCCDSILASMVATNAAYRFLVSKKCTEVLIQEIEHRSKEELTLRSNYRKFPIGSLGLDITSLNSHFLLRTLSAKCGRWISAGLRS
jgi:hypothetical protein